MIMDYEKKYKDALERARTWKEKSGMPKNKQGILDNIFPELSDSEDESIRKELISFLQLPHPQFVGKRNYEKWVAWLEKQGESTLIEEIKRRKELYSQEKEKAMSSTEKLSLGGRIAMLEELCAFIDIKQGETKTADKVEPKFKVGDWITNGATKPAQISSIEDDMYYTHNGTIGGDIESMDKDYHLWTIEDARDGDVLVDVYGNIGIFEKRYGINWHTYCYLGNKGRFIAEGGSHGSICYPATKEQCHLLFQKLNENGYIWNPEKKELNRFAKFNVHDCIIKKHNSNINDFGYFVITGITGGKYWYNDRIICDISEQDEWELYEPIRQTSSWSKEDEKKKRIANILSVLSVQVCWDGATGKKTNPYQKEIDWLKSLKEKVQSKQEWREDETEIVED